MESSAKTHTPKGSSGRSRPRASLACMNCRQRKIKCQNPQNADSCTSCRTLRIPCVVNKDGDRRKAGSRQHVAVLQERLDQLETYIASTQHNGQPPPPSNSGISDHADTSSAALPDLNSANPVQHPLSAPTQPRHSISGMPNVSPLQTAEDLLALRNSRGTASAGPALFPAPTPPKGVAGLTPPTSDQGGSRLEIDEADGRPRFYGPTSQAHIQRHSISVEHDAPHQFGDRSLGLDLDSGPLRNMLFHVFWKIQPHSQVIVDQALFQQGRESGVARSEYYSAFLETIVLACATRLSTSEEVRSLGPRYVERAKAEIVQELEGPNTATLQGFLLLSDFEATRGRDRLGYLYAGIGCRLVWDLGLPESCDDLVAHGKLSPFEANARHTLLLGAFVYDKTWSLYLGRPGQIPTNTVEIAHSRAVESGWSGPVTITPWVGLCSDMSAVTDILNNGAILDSAARTRLADLDAQIQQRLETLPSSIALHKNHVAALPVDAYSVHLQFHGLRIILHRLLYKAISQSADAAAEASNPTHHHHNLSIDHSRLIMYENAMDIAQLVSVYHQIFGIEQVITIMLDNTFVAAAVLISHVLGVQQLDANANVEQELYYLRALAALLIKAQKHYPVTLRMRCTLSSYVEGTSIAGLFGSTPSIQNSSGANGGGGGGGAAVPAIPQMQQQPRSNLTPGVNNFFTQDMLGRNDVAVFQDFGGDGIGDGMFIQEMDMPNMLSWALSPSAMRPDLGFQN